MMYNMFTFQKFQFLDIDSGATGEPFRENLLIKLRNQNIFEKFKLNKNFQMISFNMMYIAHSLIFGKVEMFLCAVCHAFTPHVNAWKR